MATTIDSLPPEIIQPILLLALRLSGPPTSRGRSLATLPHNWCSRSRTHLRLVCSFWSEIIGSGTDYSLGSQGQAVALTAAWRADPARALAARTGVLSSPGKWFFNIGEWELQQLLQSCPNIEALQLDTHPNQLETERLKNVLRQCLKLKVLDFGERALFSGKLALLLSTWPDLSELRTTRFVATNTASGPYPKLSDLTVTRINDDDALRGLSAFLTLCPNISALHIPSLESDFSRPLLLSTLRSLPPTISSLTIKINRDSSLGGILSPPVLDDILAELTSLTRLELASHGFSTFSFIHHLTKLKELSVVLVHDDMLALVPWDLEDLAKELVLLGTGRRLVVRISGALTPSSLH
ncbi:hypothetical protein RQP46_009131 [Phenoliferia psychrophenolica]